MLIFLCDFKACAKFIWPPINISLNLLFSFFLSVPPFIIFLSGLFQQKLSNWYNASLLSLPQSFFHTLPNTKLFILFPCLKFLSGSLWPTKWRSDSLSWHIHHLVLAYIFSIISYYFPIMAILNYLWLLELNEFSASFCFWNFPLAWNFLLSCSAFGNPSLATTIHFKQYFCDVDI